MKKEEEKLKMIQAQVEAMALGDFDQIFEVDEAYTKYDFIISSLNLLSEELKDVVVSKNYFYSIFNAVTNPIIIIDKHGNIQEFNDKSTHQFPSIEKAKKLYDLNNTLDKEDLEDIIKNFKDSFEPQKGKLTIRVGEKKLLFVVEFSRLKNNEFDKEELFVCSLKNITDDLEFERAIIRTTLNVQNKEQKRISNDLHDSVGQELAALRLMISSLMDENNLSEDMKIGLQKCSDLTSRSIESIRNVTHNILPSSFKLGGLKTALRDLMKNLESVSTIKVTYTSDNSEEILEEDMQLALLRVTEEFFSNSLKHAKCSVINISLNLDDGEIFFQIEDNGVGFNLSDELLNNQKSGLKNMITRVRAYEGNISIITYPGEGTGVKIRM